MPRKPQKADPGASLSTFQWQKPKATVLVLAADAEAAADIAETLETNYAVLHAQSIPRAEELIETTDIDAVIIDDAGSTESFRLLQRFIQSHESTPFVLLNSGDASDADEALNASGAAHFLPKPVSPERLRKVIHDALRTRAPRADEIVSVPFVAVSPELRRIVDDAAAAFQNRQPILLSGAAGSGKRHLALYLHVSAGLPILDFKRVDCRFDDVKKALADAAPAKTLYLEHLDALDKKAQRKLREVLQHDHATRPLAASELPVAALSEYLLPELIRSFSTTFDIRPMSQRPADAAAFEEIYEQTGVWLGPPADAALRTIAAEKWDLERLEGEYLHVLLQRHHFGEVLEMLGIDRTTLYRKRVRHGLEAPNLRPRGRKRKA